MGKADKKFDMELFFRALADRTRLRLLNLMGGGEVCVCFFVEVTGTSQPKISRHLAYLRRAGIVGARREGKWMHYQITTAITIRRQPALERHYLIAYVHCTPRAQSDAVKKGHLLDQLRSARGS